MRMVPAGLSRSSLSAASSASISSSRGPIVRRRRSPASVGATLRVVRVSSRRPAAPRARGWSGSAPTATRPAAPQPREAPLRATARKARRSLRLWRGIYEPIHWGMPIIAANRRQAQLPDRRLQQRGDTVDYPQNASRRHLRPRVLTPQTWPRIEPARPWLHHAGGNDGDHAQRFAAFGERPTEYSPVQSHRSAVPGDRAGTCRRHASRSSRRAHGLAHASARPDR